MYQMKMLSHNWLPTDSLTNCCNCYSGYSPLKMVWIVNNILTLTQLLISHRTIPTASAERGYEADISELKVSHRSVFHVICYIFCIRTVEFKNTGKFVWKSIHFNQFNQFRISLGVSNSQL